MNETEKWKKEGTTITLKEDWQMIMDVADRWNVPPVRARTFLMSCGYIE